MSKIRILHTGDCHLAAAFASLGANAERRRRDVLDAFRGLVDFALGKAASDSGKSGKGTAAKSADGDTDTIRADDEGIDIFLVAGDLFDRYDPPPHVVGEVKSEIRRLVAAGIKVVLTPGTHDGLNYKDSVYTKYDFASECYLFTEPTCGQPFHIFAKERDVFLYGFAYNPVSGRDPLDSIKRIDADGVHVAVLHASVSDRADLTFRRKDLPVSTEKLAGLGMDYVALGHYHNWAEIVEPGGRLVGVYPGTPEGMKFRESGPRYAAVVEFEPGAGVKVSQHRTNVREVADAQIDVTGLMTDDDVAEAVLAYGSGENLVARFVLVGRPEEIVNTDYVAGVIADKYFHAVIIDATSVIDSSFVRRIENEVGTIRRFFVEAMKKRIANAASEREKEKHEEALKIGLESFLRHS